MSIYLFSRTKCLRALIVNAQYTLETIYGTKNRGWMCWTDDFLYMLKYLISTGADPTWIPENSDTSALFKFFEATIHVLAHETNLHAALLETIQSFLTERAVTYIGESDKTILHVLLGTTWEQLPSPFPP